MLVSIVTPYYKSEKYIYRSIRSIVDQTYKSWELIIVDDENSKDSKFLLNKIKIMHKNIKIFYTKSNIGAGPARNLGILKSKGEFIAFLDSDDYWHKKKLEKQIFFLKKNNFDICYSGYSVFSDDKIIYKPKTPCFMNYYSFLRECPICCSSVLIKTKIFKNFKFKKYKTKEDYELWLRISKKNTFYGLNEYLTFYRSRNDSLSSNQFNKLINTYKIYKEHYGFKIYKIFFSIIRLYFNALKKRIVKRNYNK
jgi:teichuronic acid biosynthesis glycosyltransferase TuaG